MNGRSNASAQKVRNPIPAKNYLGSNRLRVSGNACRFISYWCTCNEPRGDSNVEQITNEFANVRQSREQKFFGGGRGEYVVFRYLFDKIIGSFAVTIIGGQNNNGTFPRE